MQSSRNMHSGAEEKHRRLEIGEIISGIHFLRQALLTLLRQLKFNGTLLRQYAKTISEVTPKILRLRFSYKKNDVLFFIPPISNLPENELPEFNIYNAVLAIQFALDVRFLGSVKVFPRAEPKKSILRSALKNQKSKIRSAKLNSSAV